MLLSDEDIGSVDLICAVGSQQATAWSRLPIRDGLPVRLAKGRPTQRRTFISYVSKSYGKSSELTDAQVSPTGVPEASAYHARYFVVRAKRSVQEDTLFSHRPSTDLSWVFAAMNNSPQRSTSRQIIAAVEGLNGLLKQRNFAELDYIFLIIRPANLSPELMIAFARVTFPVRKLLPSWYQFIRRIKHELDRRNADTGKLLNGLL